MNRTLSLFLFFALVLGGGLALGFLSTPGEWYADLVKPSFNPPAWLFGPVWTALYILIAIAGWRAWQRDHTGWPIRLRWPQLVLNFLWAPVFFAAHQIGMALIIIVVLLATILAFIATSWRRDRVAALLFLPYSAWVAFATALNAAILMLN